MNPSSSGWIKKLTSDLKQDNNLRVFENSTFEFYELLRLSGFIYGYNVGVVGNLYLTDTLSESDICKLNLILALKNTFLKEKGHLRSFETAAYTFYKTTFGNKLYKKDTLEDFIQYRIAINQNLIYRKHLYTITNALLFIDVLLFEKHLKNHEILSNEMQLIESKISSFINSIIDQKLNKSDFDERLQLILSNSLSSAKTNVNDGHIKLSDYPLLKTYVTDLGAMASWSPSTKNSRKLSYNISSANFFKLSKKEMRFSIQILSEFYENHNDKIGLLNSDNYIKNFYRYTSQMVKRLILRNKTRLLNEINQSKDLISLLSQSTYRQLTDTEQKKVKNQLLDIFKTIPNLAIFLLPGGSLLMPLIIKFIPQLLPSAFNDNHIEHEDH